MINEVEHYTNDPSNDVALEDALSNLRREARDLLGALDTLRRHGGPGVSEALCHQAHEIEHSLDAVVEAVNDRRNGS
jgi:hypothetical protein